MNILFFNVILHQPVFAGIENFYRNLIKHGILPEGRRYPRCGNDCRLILKTILVKPLEYKKILSKKSYWVPNQKEDIPPYCGSKRKIIEIFCVNTNKCSYRLI